MEGPIDFLQWLNPDLSSIIFSYLDDPAVIVRVSAVSRSWRQFVIANGLSKKLCLRLFPEVSSATHAIEVNKMIEPVEAGVVDGVEVDNLKRNHRVFAILARGLTPTLRKDCILEAISASSTDNYPEERIHNTLNPNDRVGDMGCYWSSEGESDPEVPETLTYKLSSKLCFVSEINIRPFQVFWEVGFPICSAKVVRFRMGHFKALDLERDLLDEFQAGHGSVDDYIVWTYISPDFPMAQVLELTNFPTRLLPLIISVSHVEVVGRPLSPAFDVELTDLFGRCKLKCNPSAKNSRLMRRA